MRPLSWQGRQVDQRVDAALQELTSRLRGTPEVVALWVGGSLATGDHVPGVSDLDLVAVTSAPVRGDLLAELVRIHEALDTGVASGLDLGVQYAEQSRLLDLEVEHPTWTHGELVDRVISLVTRAELVLHGFALDGPAPSQLLPAMGPDEVRAAARAELAGYWSWAARHPRMFWHHPVMVDLGLTGMARARHSIRTGELLTKTAAIEHANAPAWLKDQLRARRRGETVRSPRRAGYVAWRDVRRTTSSAAPRAEA